MSGTGKSTTILELQALGYQAVDLDNEIFSMWYDDDWVWNEGRVAELLSKNTGVLFISGCASNMPRFYPKVDHVVLLIAPNDVMVQRLKSRTGNAYGQTPEQIKRVLHLKKTIEPLLKKRADFMIDTSFSGATELLLKKVGL